MVETLERPRCPECSAPVVEGDTHCWMCHRVLSGAKSPSRGQPHPLAQAPRAAPPAERDLSKTRGVLLPALIILSVGFAIQGWGLAAIALILCMPAYFTLAFADNLSKAREERAARPQAERPAGFVEGLSRVFEFLLRAAGVLVLVFIAVSFALAATCTFILALAGSK